MITVIKASSRGFDYSYYRVFVEMAFIKEYISIRNFPPVYRFSHEDIQNVCWSTS